MKLKIQKVNLAKDKDKLPLLLDMLPSWRLEKALSFHFDIDKYLCAKSFLILKEMLLKEFNLNNIPKFSYNKNQKPYFKEYPNIHFNISHCKSGIACAVSNSPIGIDIEEINLYDDIKENVLSKEELQAIKISKSPNEEFTKFWTMKESYLKLIGTGINDNMKDILNTVDKDVKFKTYIEKNSLFLTTVAYKANTDYKTNFLN